MPTSRSTAIPCLCYRDAPAALDWLCQVFGFSRQLVVPGEAGKVAHAQLTLNGGMIMVGSAYDNDYGRHIAQPD